VRVAGVVEGGGAGEEGRVDGGAVGDADGQQREELQRRRDVVGGRGSEQASEEERGGVP
jgi:hypothetical protein